MKENCLIVLLAESVEVNSERHRGLFVFSQVVVCPFDDLHIHFFFLFLNLNLRGSSRVQQVSRLLFDFFFCFFCKKKLLCLLCNWSWIARFPPSLCCFLGCTAACQAHKLDFINLTVFNFFFVPQRIHVTCYMMKNTLCEIEKNGEQCASPAVPARNLWLAFPLGGAQEGSSRHYSFFLPWIFHRPVRDCDETFTQRFRPWPATKFISHSYTFMLFVLLGRVDDNFPLKVTH